MAVGAGHGDVPAGQRELRFLVLGKREGRRLVSIQSVALVAGVEVRCGDKLSGVLIFVARSALVKLDFEERVLAFGDVTLVAVHAGVPAFERIGAGGMVFHCVGRRLPTLHGVAGEALATAMTFGKLSVVRIGLVAIRALVENQRLLEVAVGVALFATDRRVLAFQRVLGFRVIEILVHRLLRDSLPTPGAMAGGTCLGEAAVVRVLVAIGTQVERNACVPRLAIGPVGVALGALHLGVETGQRIPRLRVIELVANLQRLPIFVVVTLQAIRAQAAFVIILVARDAGGG